MTKLPHPSWTVAGLEESPQFPRYTVGPLCSQPMCSRPADHVHHIWRRSFIIGDKPWVRLENGRVVGNLTGLCWRHHDKVTVGEADIVWDGEGFAWAEYGRLVRLNPQPPSMGHGDLVLVASEKKPPKIEGQNPHEHVGPASVEKCPECNRPFPRETSGHEEPRPRKNWSVSVPVDERENGADVLDTLLKECSIIFGHADTKKVRYFTVAQALSLVVQNKEKFLADD